VVGRLNQVVQYTMMIVVERDETERLEHHVGPAAYWFQHFGHALHIARLGLECDLDEVTFRQRLRHLQKTAGGGDCLQLGLGALAVAEG